MLGAVALGTLALLHGLVWRVQRQRWSAYFAVGLALCALLYAFDEFTRPSGNDANPLGSLLGAASFALFILGLIDYVRTPARRARQLGGLLIGLGSVVLVLRMLDLVPRAAGFATYAVWLAVLAGHVAMAVRHEPRRGHLIVVLAMLTYPAAAGAMLIGWVPMPVLRYMMILPGMIIGMTVLTTGLLRASAEAAEALARQRLAETELRRVNESLEQRVQDRTTELADMVKGLESFNRSVTHDLRGPLGGIANAVELSLRALERGDLDAVRRFVTLAGAQAHASTELISALLMLARAGESPLELQPVDTRVVAASALEPLKAQRGPDEPWPVTVEPMPWVVADAALLRQVFANLVGNAIKFSRDAAEPRVTVGACEVGGQVQFCVRDNGVGFDKQQADQLFEPFRRLHGNAYPGHGVGLSIVKRIVERHGGRLWAESTPGQGSSFCFTLHSASQAAQAAAGTPAHASAAPSACAVAADHTG